MPDTPIWIHMWTTVLTVLANYEGALKRRGTAIEFFKGKIEELHEHYYKRGLKR